MIRTMHTIRLSACWLAGLLAFGIVFLPPVAIAKSSKAIITQTGTKLSQADIRRRLQRLLRELGEPRWSRRELGRLTHSVSAYLRAFTGRQYDKTLLALRRGDRYRPMIRAKLAYKGLPLAFEALPMAESAYRFNAHSRSRARGLWQFMAPSARHYGLKVGRQVDHRTDPARASDAAVKYLKFLNRKFAKTSALLTIAAYNAGEGRIAKVVRRSGVKNRRRGYSHVLRYLPRETRGYVPEFLAAALIVKDPAHFGFPVARKTSYRYVQIRDPQAIQHIAQLAKIPVKRLLKLNPELKSYRRIPTSNYLVRLPKKPAQRLDRKLTGVKIWRPVGRTIALQQASKNQRVALKQGNRTIYRVKRGNTLSTIANIFGVSTKDLRQANGLRRNRIVAGQTLIIPGKKTLARKYYRVKNGDILGLIARRLGVSVKHLMQINGVTNPRHLRQGQKLYFYDS